MTVYLDISELVRNPVRSGIQRVISELCRHWPADLPLVPVAVLDEERMGVLQGARTMLERYMNTLEDLSSCLSHTVEEVHLRPGDGILVPELFYDPRRIAFYEKSSREFRANTFCIVYDLIPLTRPELFDLTSFHFDVWSFFRLLRSFGHLGFISETTKADYYGRLLRTGTGPGPVLRLGADGLGSSTQLRKKPTREISLVVPGSVELKKHPEIVLQALEPLLTQNPQISLTFIGRVAPPMRGLFERATLRSPQIRVLSDVPDDRLKAAVENACATIFISSAEGYGLPAVESLALGTPVIVSAGLPSVEGLGDKGIVTLSKPDPEELRKAVSELLQPDFYARMLAQISQLQLPKWADFSRQAAAWVAEACMQSAGR